MLVLKVTMVEDRTTGQKEELIERLSQAAAAHLGWSLKEVRVAIYEVGELGVVPWQPGGTIRRTIEAGLCPTKHQN